MSTLAIVGAGALLGRAVARRFAAEGFDIALIARNPDALESIAGSISGVRVGVFPADITDRAALSRALADAEQQLGPIEALEFSPTPRPSDLAQAPFVDAADLTVESLVPHVELHLYGCVAAVGQVLPGMLARGSGTILLTAGAVSSRMVVPQIANVAVAVSALRSYALNLNAGLADRGVFAAHVSIAANIGQGRPGSEPDVIAEEYWKLHVSRDQADYYYHDLADTPPVLSDRYTAG
ncbi:SDR family NAD(P)-dependent oxidoreductase [Jidongwangia harbinensis]|uniref:SDR family NAD(P)-dependent oxidoreductase n=1 Tax=Jidongwangia harbinensis TaxID=2878561 RepID=UPI001CD9D6DF|nr:SDR family NAD(P)-dependent oxidoreductase [Jidongwangia harbinensis]MCA2212033.1 SDR family NAD(P)-dependent oxidoreductase [Jidongwangia harbinensis]